MWRAKMNFFKKAYCRTSQAIFKFAIPFLPYTSPKISEKVTDIPLLLEGRTALIITDKSIKELHLTDPLEESLKAAGIDYALYDGTVPNPTVANVEEAVRIYRENNCSAIIGFGGGSPIDCAKITGAVIARPKRDIRKFKGVFRVMRKLPFLIAVPTTAGTGSETTASALVTDGETHSKFPINDLFLIPDVAILDRDLTLSLPPRITSTTGMDALTHAVEAFIGRSTVRSTREDAKRAVRLIFENLEKAYANGNDPEARKNMLYASFYAGRAFAKSYVGYCHAVAHSLGGKYNIPHGLANAVLLPYVLDAYGDSVYKKLKKLAVYGGICGEEISDKEGAEIFIKHIREMNARMGIPTTLQGIKKEDIKKLAVIAEKEANPFYPVPRLFTAEELETFYYDLLEENK